ncbi:MAG: hypothetical protein ABS939_15350 [Psychrobacillus sp.]
MIRKFNANNVMKGNITWQMGVLAKNGAITFEKGARRNTCIVIVNESMIDSINLKYLYSKLLPESREIKGV